MKNKTGQSINKILIVVLWIVLAMSFFFVYTWIAFNNTIIDDYLEFRKLPHEATKVLFDNKFPSKFNIRYINILASMILLLAVLLILSLIFINKYKLHFGQKLSNIFKFSILIIAPILVVISIALFNYSAYNYYYVNEWTKKIYSLYKDKASTSSNTIRDGIQNKIPNEYKLSVLKIVANIIEKIDNNKNYNWVDLSSSWWLLELQVLVTVICAFRLNTTINFEQNDEFESKKVKLLYLKKTTGDPFSKSIISSLTATSGKNVILWFIFMSIIIFLPQFVYIFYISSHYSVARKLLSFTYEVPNMVFSLGTYNLTDTMYHAPSSIIYVYYAPLISLCVMSSIIIGFIYFFLNSKTLSFSTTLYLITVYILVAIIALTFILNSQIQFEKLIKFWNSQDNYFKISATSQIFGSVVQKANNVISNVWLSGHELISSIILSYSFLIVLSLLSLMQMFKVSKQVNVKKIFLDKN